MLLSGTYVLCLPFTQRVVGEIMRAELPVLPASRSRICTRRAFPAG